MSSGIEGLGSLARSEEIPTDSLGVLLQKHKINDEEFSRLRKILGRLPTMAELGVFSSMWSEHCSYKSSRVHLKRFPTKGPQVVVPPGENAGVVRLHEKLCVAFKMESHNHPSYLEPYQGAATGVGGILRDVFCMGARPIANLNCLRFGKRSHPRTGYLLRQVVKGIGDYGNCMGIPTVGGNISFDESYDGNCLVNAMTVGLIHEDEIFKGYASGTGNLVVYLGSSTGRDGIHGATMASDSFAAGAEQEERGAVQVGDPFMEKLLMEATLEVLDKGLVVGLQDMGAAGLTSSSFEMASRAGSGLYLDLDKIPVRTKNMSAYELLLSESQERMLMVVEPKHWDALVEVFEKWQLAYGVIGEVTGTGRVQASFQGRLEVDIPVDPITEEAPKYERPCRPSQTVGDLQCVQRCDEIAAALAKSGRSRVLASMLSDTGSKKPLYEQYDCDIGTKTVFSSKDGGAALLWLRTELNEDKDNLGLAVATACNERYCSANAFYGGAMAVLKAAKMIAATGATPLAVTDCLNFGNPEVPEVMQQFSDAVDGISEACDELNTPVVSGNVSLYNETDGSSIHPTPMIGMVGRHDDVSVAKPASLKSEADLYWLANDNIGAVTSGSLLEKALGFSPLSINSPRIDWPAERELIADLKELVAQDDVLACRDVGDGGLELCAAKMCLDVRLCYQLSKDSWSDLDWLVDRGGYLLALRPGTNPSHPRLSLVGRVEVGQFDPELMGAYTNSLDM